MKPIYFDLKKYDSGDRMENLADSPEIQDFLFFG